MDKQVRQKIVIALSLSDTDKNLILNGIRISSVFRKELCLMYNFQNHSKKDRSSDTEKLNVLTSDIQNRIESLKVTSLFLTLKTTKLPSYIADVCEGILFVAASGDYSKYSKALRESRIPFLFVNSESGYISEFRKIVFPVDLRKAVNECALWSSYFGRFNRSEIVLIPANDNDDDNRRLVFKNLRQIQSFFQKLKINFSIQKGTKTSMGNGMEALEYSKISQADLIVIAGSTYISLPDLLIGLPEKKMVKKSGHIPVLVINPRIENYMMCEDCG
jgi:hypothetical protein